MIRTYHHTENYVIDHISNTKSTFIEVMHKNEIDNMIENNAKIRILNEKNSSEK